MNSETVTPLTPGSAPSLAPLPTVPPPAPLSFHTTPPSVSESSASAELVLSVSVLLVMVNAPGLLPLTVLALVYVGARPAPQASTIESHTSVTDLPAGRLPMLTGASASAPSLTG